MDLKGAERFHFFSFHFETFQNSNQEAGKALDNNNSFVLSYDTS